MTPNRVPHRSSRKTLPTFASVGLSAIALVLGSALGGSILGACGGGGSSQVSTGKPGKVADKPGGGFYIVDANHAGNGQEPRVVRQMSGRLVEVYGFDALGSRVPMASKFVVDEAILGDSQDFLLETNPVTAQQNLLVLRDVTDTSKGGGRDQFFSLLMKAEATLGPIQSNDSNQSGTYSMVPRNSVVVVQFDDLMDAKSIDQTTFRTLVGNPPIIPFEGRVFADPNHGDVILVGGAPKFYSTRIIFDPTVTEIESFENDPPLPINGVGLPAAAEVNLANFEIRIPTKVNLSYGQNHLLQNVSGHPLTTKNNGPVDFSSPTLDVVRAARSGGPSKVTSDPFNGFLRDLDGPRIVGSNQILLAETPVPTNGFDEFVLPVVVFKSEFCSQTPQPGDVLRQPGVFAEVLEAPDPVQNGQVNDLSVRLLLWPSAWDAENQDGPLEWMNNAIGDGDFLAAFEPTEDEAFSPCFVRIFPTAKGFPDNPGTGLYTASTFSIRFSEPMDPTSVTAFDSLTLTRVEDPTKTSDFVVGGMTQSLDLQEFTFVPDLPLAHENGSAESYFVTVLEGDNGPIDLAGNPLADAIPRIELSVDADEPSQFNGGRVSRFVAVDEEEPFGTDESGPLPEWSGQHLYDLQRQLLRPRPVIHYNAVCDRSRPVIQLMTAFTSGVQTPLSGLGSKLQSMWRYIDFGFSLTDLSTHNIDVEGLYWSPAGGSVVADTFSDFQVEIAHSDASPDEAIDPDSLFPAFPASGIDKKFVANLLDKKKDPFKVIHQRVDGYYLSPGEVFVSQVSGTKLMPWPVNRNASPEDWKTWTWRNTDVRARAGKNSGGSDPDILFTALGIPAPCNDYYREGQVRTIGLAMLLQFSCYPDEGAAGVNALDLSLASNSSSRPYFRAFSTGGYNQSGNRITIDPDTETDANGGFNPGSNPPGAKTWFGDCSFYIGAADFVTRVSRSHSIWFEAINPLTGIGFENPIYLEPSMEPLPEAQPTGTAITLAFRGMRLLNAKPWSCDENVEFRDALFNAGSFDSYGDVYDDDCLTVTGNCEPVPNHNSNNENSGIKWLNTGDDEWKDSVEEIATATYYQVRVTFESDIFTGLVPELSALAVSWYE